jgi:hypothetical protein
MAPVARLAHVPIGRHGNELYGERAVGLLILVNPAAVPETHDCDSSGGKHAYDIQTEFQPRHPGARAP